MPICQRLGGTRVELAKIGHFIRADTGMIAVVRADELDFVDSDLLGARRSEPQQEEDGELHQNTIRSANWVWRAGNVALNTPKPLLFALVPLTVAKLVLLSKLNASARNCRYFDSEIEKLL